jgi:hypothetical protein
MPFFVKQPCIRGWVDRSAYKPLTVGPTPAHMSCYQALYDPNNHVNVFTDRASTCSWLADLLSSNGAPHTMSFFDDEFLVQHERLCVTVAISPSDVAAASFHPIDMDVLVSNCLDSVPHWMKHSDVHFLSLFHELGRLALMNALEQAGCAYPRRSSLKTLGQCLLHSVREKIAFVINLSLADLWKLVGDQSLWRVSCASPGA